MEYKFVNKENNRTAVFRDKVEEGRPLIWGDRYEEYQAVKTIERLLEVDRLPIGASNEPGELVIEIDQGQVGLMMDNLVRNNYYTGRGSLHSILKKLLTQ